MSSAERDPVTGDVNRHNKNSSWYDMQHDVDFQVMLRVHPFAAKEFMLWMQSLSKMISLRG